jgi:integrase
VQRGSLQIVKDRHGVKVWRVQWRENGRGRTRILGRVSELSRAEARAELDRILSAAPGATAGRKTSPVTLRRFVLDEYLTVRSRVWKRSTAATTDQLIRDHILEALGDRPIASISRRELQDHLDGLARAGLSASVVGHVRWQLRAIFAMAQADGLVAQNPATALLMPRCKAAPAKLTISIEVIQRAQLALELRERLFFRLAVCEGMRPGEIAALQVQDIKDDGIHIERRVYRGQIDSPKSWRSRRVVPPTPGTHTLIRAWIDLLRDRRPEAWLFPSERGITPIDPGNLWRRRIQPALKTAGVSGVNYQALRRTWVSQMAEAERDPKIRAALAGHSVDVSENEYRQPDVARLEAAMQKLHRRLLQ